ncbi:hypothetical protein KIPB_006869, partial [Kipferlia bialata]
VTPPPSPSEQDEARRVAGRILCTAVRHPDAVHSLNALEGPDPLPVNLTGTLGVIGQAQAKQAGETTPVLSTFCQSHVCAVLVKASKDTLPSVRESAATAVETLSMSSAGCTFLSNGGVAPYVVAAALFELGLQVPDDYMIPDAAPMPVRSSSPVSHPACACLLNACTELVASGTDTLELLLRFGLLHCLHAAVSLSLSLRDQALSLLVDLSSMPRVGVDVVTGEGRMQTLVEIGCSLSLEASQAAEDACLVLANGCVSGDGSVLVPMRQHLPALISAINGMADRGAKGMGEGGSILLEARPLTSLVAVLAQDRAMLDTVLSTVSDSTLRKACTPIPHHATRPEMYHLDDTRFM